MKFIQFSVSIFVLLSALDIFSQYTNPESVTFDSVGNRYLVSNTPVGIIKQRSAAGVVTDFVTVGGVTHGLTIHNGVVYICNGTRVRGYALSNAADVFNVQLTGSSFLNDISIDNSGIAYVTDFTTQRIYKLNTNTQAWWIYVPATGRTPNGIYVDSPRNRLLVCCWGSSPNVIKRVNLADSSISDITTLNYGNCDGITLDKYDNVYVSSWSPQRVVRFDIGFTLPAFEVITSGLANPADIFINKSRDTLAVPNAGNNTVTFHFIGNISGLAQTGNSIPENFSLGQNYPNHFNPTTKIEFDIPGYEILSEAKNPFINLVIYDIMGREISTLVNRVLEPGKYIVDWNAAEYSSDVYFYRLKAGKFTDTKMMILNK